MDRCLLCATLVLTLLSPHVTGVRHNLYEVMNHGFDFVLKRNVSHGRSLTQVTPAAELNYVSAAAAERISRVSDTDVHAVSPSQSQKPPPPRASSRDGWPLCKEDSLGMAMGCRSHCNCGWGQQCYPKWMPLKEALFGEDKGICETAVPVLALASFIIFSLVLVTFVALRTCLQWRNAEDDAGFIKPAMLRSTQKPLTCPSNSGVAAAQSGALPAKADARQSQSGLTVGGSAETDSESESEDSNSEPDAASSPKKEEADARSPQRG